MRPRWTSELNLREQHVCSAESLGYIKKKFIQHVCSSDYFTLLGTDEIAFRIAWSVVLLMPET